MSQQSDLHTPLPMHMQKILSSDDSAHNSNINQKSQIQESPTQKAAIKSAARKVSIDNVRL